jgi:hypothetical protein
MGGKIALARRGSEWRISGSEKHRGGSKRRRHGESVSNGEKYGESGARGMAAAKIIKRRQSKGVAAA